jgi:F-type H+-transporting ATPase subunit epsilon
MSERQFLLTVVTPDKCLYKDEPALAVGAVGTQGAFTALPGHAPFLTDLKPGNAWYKDVNGVVDTFVVLGGFVEVLPDRVTILADSADRLDEIDADRARQSQARAAEELAKAKAALALKQAEGETTTKGVLSPEEKEARKKMRIEIFQAEAALARAAARIKASRDKSKLPHKPLK